MNYELDVTQNGKIAKVFFKSLVMNEAALSKVIHSHRYAEIHIIFQGCADILIENSTYTCTPGDMLLIPDGMYHCYRKTTPDAGMIAFQMEGGGASILRKSISQNVMNEVVSLFQKDSFYTEREKTAALLGYILAFFSAPSPIRQTSDTATIIHEFISNNYGKNAPLSALAEQLHLSAKQTERHVKATTGKTFRHAMTDYRLKIADHLEKYTDMSPTAIAAYVGYANYSGYWKARRQWNKDK